MTSELSQLLKEIAASPQVDFPDPNVAHLHSAIKSQTLDAKMERIRERKIRNDNRESDQKMKKWSLIALFIFLAIETMALFTLAFFQGFGGGPNGWFHLDEWCFNIVIGATLAQIAYMLTIAIKHLFPSK